MCWVFCCSENKVRRCLLCCLVTRFHFFNRFSIHFTSFRTRTDGDRNLSRKNTAAPSVRVFFAATRRKMYREPVSNRQKRNPFQQVLDTLHFVSHSNRRRRKSTGDKHCGTVSSSFFRSNAEKNVSRTGE